MELAPATNVVVWSEFLLLPSSFSLQNMPPKFIYFDLGNVLTTFSNERMCLQMGQLAGLSEQQVIDMLMPTGTQQDILWQFEAGRLSEDEFYQWFCQQTGVQPNRRELEYACADMFAPIDASMELATKLSRAGHRIGVLSNTNPWHWNFVTDGRYPVLNEAFEIRLTSFDAGDMKPAASIYHRATELAGVSAGEILFTDDRPENIEGAQAVGIDAVQFRSTQQLQEELAARGVQW